ncbi:MAG: hypothetical protein DBY32_09340 [Phascolarctobacterium sp.]|nr:MAG: hypothetical protein DBY32_09340 [Phascolarctobacterium sp.]
MPYMPQYVKEQRKSLVEEIIKDMQGGKVFMWDKGFTAKPAVNAVTNSPYRGGNIIRLAYSAYRNGFTDRRWMTFKQAQKKGYKIKKGAKGTSIEYFDIKQFETAKDKGKNNAEKATEETRLETHNIAFVKTYVVFNGDQIEGLPDDEKLNKNRDELRIEEMEQLLKNSEAQIYYDQMNQNFYNYQLDEIHIVPRERFDDNSHFYGTAAHEIVHSTGHESRLNRELQTADKEKYAREELVAELTTMFMAQEYGFSLDDKHKENHKAYIVSWCKALKENPDELFRAARFADKALYYINDKMLGKDKNREQEKEQPKIQEKAQVKEQEQVIEPVKHKETERKAKKEKQATPKKEVAKGRKGRSREKGLAM